MGETVLPTVEESSPQTEEPPICGLNGPNSKQQLNAGDGATPTTLHAPHTLSFEEVAERLQVDIQ